MSKLFSKYSLQKEGIVIFVFFISFINLTLGVSIEKKNIIVSLSEYPIVQDNKQNSLQSEIRSEDNISSYQELVQELQENDEEESMNLNTTQIPLDISEKQTNQAENRTIEEKKQKHSIVVHMHEQMGIIQTVYYTYFQKLTNHLGGQRDMFLVILGTLIVFSVVLIALINTRQDFPFLKNLDLQNTLKTQLKLEQRYKENQEDELFYESYNLSGEKAYSESEDSGESYVSASDYKLQRKNDKMINSEEWKSLKGRAQQYSSFENNPMFSQYKKRQSQKSKERRGNETLDFIETNIDINEMLNQMENQSFLPNNESNLYYQNQQQSILF